MSATPAEPVKPACAAGALRQLYTEHYEFVWRSARRLGTPAANVDDVVQDVFIVAARRMAAFEGRSSWRTWLFGIAVHTVQAHRRAEFRHRRKTRLRRVAPPQPSTAQQDAITTLDRLLERLDDDKRTVFILAELEEMTAPEIAEALGIKVNTVYSRLRLARAHLHRVARRVRAQEARR